MIKTKYPTIKPSLNLDFANTKSLDPRITFRRGTPGTYYDGVTHAKAEENLLSYSEDFSQWSKYELSVTSNDTTAPDGSTTADKISDSTVDGAHALYKILTYTKGTYIFSSFFKSSGDDRYIAFRSYIGAGYYFYVVFDPVTGSVTHSENAGQSIITLISASSVSYSGGWHRGIVVFNVSGTYNNTSLGWQITNSPVVDASSNPHNSSFVGDGSSGFYLWGAQLEQRDTVTSYTATNGTPITKYQPKLMTAAADNARFDCDPITGESKGLLIEESRTNLIAYSEDFTQSFWNENRSSALTNDHVFPNQLIAPDGVSLATKIVPRETESNAIHYVGSSNLSLSENTVYTVSCYFKAAEIDTVSIALKKYDGSNNWVNFNLTDVTATPVHTFDDYSIEDVGNGWRRCSVSLNLGAGADANAGILYFYVKQASGWIGNNYDGLYMWGAQVETGSFPTSYIKTTGASATRSADNASITGENFSSWYRQDEGSIYADILPNYAIHYGTAALSIGATKDSLSFSPGGKGQVRFFIRTNDVSEATIDRTGYSGYNLKLSASYASDYAYFSVNGDTIGEDTSVLLPSVDLMNIGQDRFQSKMCAHIKKIAYYPQRLTNEQLQNLTK